MPVLRQVLGLDLGSHTLKAVELVQQLRGIEAVQLRSLPRVDPAEPEADLAQRLQTMFHLHRLSAEHVVTALPGDSVSARRLHFPFRERRKLAQAVPFAVEGELPFDLEQVVVDWEIVGSRRAGSDVVATVAPRSQVAALLDLLTAAGCAPRTLEAEGLVLGNLAAIFDLPGVRLLADLGHRKSTLCLIADGRALAARTLPLGGAEISAALARDCGVSLEEAERIKCEEGVFPEGGGDAPHETERVLDRLAREIVRTQTALEEVTAPLGTGRIEGLTLFGGTAQLRGLDEYLGARTGIPSERLGLPDEAHGSGLVAGGPPILYAPAIALALRGTTLARTRMNFRQNEFAYRRDLGRLRRDLRSTASLAAACLGLAALSCGTDAWLTARRARDLEGASAALYGEVFPDRSAPANALAALRDEVRSAHERAEFLGVYRGNLSALDLLTEISKLVPSDLDVVFEELSIDRQTVRMRVFAKSFEAADRLGLELGKFPPFAAARIGSIETDARTNAKRFNVTISLSPPERG